jgi:hypothetical protein
LICCSLAALILVSGVRATIGHRLYAFARFLSVIGVSVFVVGEDAFPLGLYDHSMI